jgi:hypothetical protein
VALALLFAWLLVGLVTCAVSSALTGIFRIAAYRNAVNGEICKRVRRCPAARLGDHHGAGGGSSGPAEILVVAAVAVHRGLFRQVCEIQSESDARVD